jgi:pyruvate dehydrogenase E2 component (dihydrolipoamide acetyltransferase)
LFIGSSRVEDMITEFKLPDLGENIEAGDVVQWLVNEGDVIQAGQNVLELETDKAVIELPCPHAGRVVRLHVKAGDRVPVGAVLLTIDTAGSGAAPAATAEQTPPVTPVRVPPKPQGPPVPFWNRLRRPLRERPCRCRRHPPLSRRLAPAPVKPWAPVRPYAALRGSWVSIFVWWRARGRAGGSRRTT